MRLTCIATAARQVCHTLGGFWRNHGEYIEIRRFAGEPIVANDEAADAVEVGGPVERGVQV